MKATVLSQSRSSSYFITFICLILVICGSSLIFLFFSLATLIASASSSSLSCYCCSIRSYFLRRLSSFYYFFFSLASLRAIYNFLTFKYSISSLCFCSLVFYTATLVFADFDSFSICFCCLSLSSASLASIYFKFSTSFNLLATSSSNFYFSTYWELINSSFFFFFSSFCFLFSSCSCKTWLLSYSSSSICYYSRSWSILSASTFWFWRFSSISCLIFSSICFTMISVLFKGSPDVCSGWISFFFFWDAGEAIFGWSYACYVYCVSLFFSASSPF